MRSAVRLSCRICQVHGGAQGGTREVVRASSGGFEMWIFVVRSDQMKLDV